MRMESGVGDGRLEFAAYVLKRLRAGDRLDEVARDDGTTVHAIRRVFSSFGIEREDLELLRSTAKSPRLKLPDGLAPFASRRKTHMHADDTSTRSRWTDDDLIRCL